MCTSLTLASGPCLSWTAAGTGRSSLLVGRGPLPRTGLPAAPPALVSELGHQPSAGLHEPAAGPCACPWPAGSCACCASARARRAQVAEHPARRASMRRRRRPSPLAAPREHATPRAASRAAFPLLHLCLRRTRFPAHKNREQEDEERRKSSTLWI